MEEQFRHAVLLEREAFQHQVMQERELFRAEVQKEKDEIAKEKEVLTKEMKDLQKEREELAKKKQTVVTTTTAKSTTAPVVATPAPVSSVKSQKEAPIPTRKEYLSAMDQPLSSDWVSGGIVPSATQAAVQPAHHVVRVNRNISAHPHSTLLNFQTKDFDVD
jgi:hypothetical protein